MPTTPNYAIPYPDGSTAFTPLQQKFADIALGVDSALTTGIGGSPRLANSDAERNGIYPTPVQGNTVNRPDKGYTERYFGTFNPTTNPGGANPAGWYPDSTGMSVFLGTFTGTVNNGASPGVGTSTLPYTEVHDPFDIHNATTNPDRITPKFPGLYRVTLFSGFAGNTNGVRTVAGLKTAVAIPGMSPTVSAAISAGGQQSTSGVVDMNGSTDYVTFTTSQNSGSNLVTTGSVAVDYLGPKRG